MRRTDGRVKELIELLRVSIVHSTHRCSWSLSQAEGGVKEKLRAEIEGEIGEEEGVIEKIGVRIMKGMKEKWNGGIMKGETMKVCEKEEENEW